jgi:RecG-like helicase
MTIPISDVRWRHHVEIEGTVEVLTIRPASFSAAVLEIQIADGQSVVTAVFFGYRKIEGIKPGRRLRIEGLVNNWEGKLAFLNPIYTLLAPAS